MPRPYRPLALANSLIIGFGYVDGIDHMKLQKLVYLAHGWWLAYHDESILDERPQVWRYGPVFASMYHALKGFGEHPIRFLQRDILNQPPPALDEQDEDALALIDWVWGRYGGFAAVRLSDMTHAIGTPWRTIAEERKYRVPSNFAMPDDLIRQYFRDVEPKRLQGPHSQCPVSGRKILPRTSRGKNPFRRIQPEKQSARISLNPSRRSREN